MKVIIKEPNKESYEAEIKNELEELQKIVGGYIEVVAITFDSIVICNEEGKLRGMPHNFYTPVHDIVGTVIVCDDTEEGEFADVSMSTEDFNKILKDWGNEV